VDWFLVASLEKITFKRNSPRWVGRDVECARGVASTQLGRLGPDPNPIFGVVAVKGSTRVLEPSLDVDVYDKIVFWREFAHTSHPCVVFPLFCGGKGTEIFGFSDSL